MPKTYFAIDEQNINYSALNIGDHVVLSDDEYEPHVIRTLVLMSLHGQCLYRFHGLRIRSEVDLVDEEYDDQETDTLEDSEALDVADPLGSPGPTKQNPTADMMYDEFYIDMLVTQAGITILWEGDRNNHRPHTSNILSRDQDIYVDAFSETNSRIKLTPWQPSEKIFYFHGTEGQQQYGTRLVAPINDETSIVHEMTVYINPTTCMYRLEKTGYLLFKSKHTMNILTQGYDYSRALSLIKKYCPNAADEVRVMGSLISKLKVDRYFNIINTSNKTQQLDGIKDILQPLGVDGDILDGIFGPFYVDLENGLEAYSPFESHKNIYIVKNGEILYQIADADIKRFQRKAKAIYDFMLKGRVGRNPLTGEWHGPSTQVELHSSIRGAIYVQHSHSNNDIHYVWVDEVLIETSVPEEVQLLKDEYKLVNKLKV